MLKTLIGNALLISLIVLIGRDGLSQTINLSDQKREKVMIALDEYAIIDTNLMKEIDAFLVAERVCRYYTDSLKLSVDICDWNGKIGDDCVDSDTLSVTISSITRKDLFFFNAIGFFNYDGHLIAIHNIASEKFFKPISKKREFTYNKILSFIDDDSTTYWTFKYMNNKFRIDHEKYNCPSLRKR